METNNIQTRKDEIRFFSNIHWDMYEKKITANQM